MPDISQHCFSVSHYNRKKDCSKVQHYGFMQSYIRIIYTVVVIKVSYLQFPPPRLATSVS